MRLKTGLALSILLLSIAGYAHAGGDAAAGKAKSSVCVSCHGKAGISAVGTFPNLAGQKKEYIAKALNDFRGGARKNAMMSSIASGLNDADIANLAEYYSSLKH